MNQQVCSGEPPQLQNVDVWTFFFQNSVHAIRVELPHRIFCEPYTSTKVVELVKVTF